MVTSADGSVSLSQFSEVLENFCSGKMIIVIDDADRENEADLIIAAEKVSTEAINFMMSQGRGLVCVSIVPELAEKLELPLQTVNNNSPFSTAFTVSIDHKSVCKAGVTAGARAETIRSLTSPGALAADYVRPGHVFPLIANPAGVIAREGHTEAAYDMARIAGFFPAGVLCELLDKDGLAMRGTQINDFANRHSLKITSIKEIIKYRACHEVLVREVARSVRETDYGLFDTRVFQDDVDGKEHLALIYGDLSQSGEAVLCRIHSECLTGDVFESRRCDCGNQLSSSIQMIKEKGQGVLLYLRQEGRGIGLENKVRAYALQDAGYDTVEANTHLGFRPDERDFAVAAKILSSLQIAKIDLITNNPQKISSIERHGMRVSSRLPLITPHDELCQSYLRTKREKLGHYL
jgi:3,4-dihydroxy 2-butanone 4-phosphate synthase/GTP cyclohydrolase II